MRTNVLRMLGVAVIMSMMVMASPASVVMAAEEVSLDPEEGAIGDTIEVTGEGFNESDEDSEDEADWYYVDIYFSGEEAEEEDEIDSDVENYDKVKTGIEVDGSGEWDTTFKIPSVLGDGEDDVDVESGTYFVYVTYEEDSEIVAVAEFTITAPEIEIDPEEGPVGTEVEISGTGFSSSSDIAVKFGTATVDIEDGDDATDSDGEFECTIIVPEAPAGNSAITVTDEDDVDATLDFTVEPSMEVSPTTVASAGTSVKVSGTGFEKSSEVTVWVDGDEVEVANSSSKGSFNVSFVLPADILSGGARTVTVEVSDEDGNSAEDSLSITYTAPTTPPPTTPTTPTTPPTTPTTPTTPTIPTTPPSSPSDFGGVPLWAIAVGGVLVLLILILVVYMLMKR